MVMKEAAREVPVAQVGGESGSVGAEGAVPDNLLSRFTEVHGVAPVPVRVAVVRFHESFIPYPLKNITGFVSFIFN
jgi:hypothetical protein